MIYLYMKIGSGQISRNSRRDFVFASRSYHSICPSFIACSSYGSFQTKVARVYLM